MNTALFPSFTALPLSVTLLVFVVSLVITIGAAHRFTSRLETVADLFDLSPSLLSLFSALGANIPNYAASIDAIVRGQLAVGLGIIIGSNIYNIAIILSISTFATPAARGIVLLPTEAQDVRLVARYTLAIMVASFLMVALLSVRQTVLSTTASDIVSVLILTVFVILSAHALRRHPHTTHTIEHPQEDVPTRSGISGSDVSTRSGGAVRLFLYLGEIVLALLISLGGVVVMVEAAQAAATKIHMPDAILGLVVLAIATSLPNTVVAFSLARAHRAVAAVEEIFSSNSINASLGVAFPLLFWHWALHDSWLLWLDTPLMVLLAGAALLCISRRRVSHLVAALFLLVYVGWIAVHLLLRIS